MRISKDFSLEYPNIEISYENSKEKIALEFYDLSDMIISDLLSNQKTEKRIILKEKIFENEYQGYKGFLVPGIVALSIMQSGILGVVFTLISYKTQGVLKRLQATPIDPSHFLIGQMISRLLIIVIQTFVLFIIGTLILNIDIALGSIFAWINIIIFSVLGSILFLFIGLAISGASPNEDYAAPIANLITFPMMFLSGVFFDTDIFPNWLSLITNNLPLSPLVNSLRESALYGTNTLELLPELSIMLVWIIVAFIIGIKTFKWE
jgi:ABC-2 type transport system permease protein